MTIHYKQDTTSCWASTALCVGIARNGRRPMLTVISDPARVTCKRCLAKLAKRPPMGIARVGLECLWVLDGVSCYTPIEPDPCPMCGACAITALPPPLLKVQPDDTTHVCNPALGGCNHGFAKVAS